MLRTALLLAAVLLAVGLAALLAARPAVAQTPAPAPAEEALTVSVDCPGDVPGCDVAFFQTEVPFVRFVRDLGGADVAVLVTQQETGGGGRRYDLFLRGRRAAAGRVDTLTVQTEPGATDDAQRRALLSRLALGLAGFAARTGLADRLSVAYAAPAAGAPTAAAARDPWNAWVFRVQGQGYFNGQQQTSSADLYGSVSASRVTDLWKLTLSPNASLSRNRFVRGDGTAFVSRLTSVGLFGQVVRALSPHWSAALRGNAERSTFENLAVRGTLGPAVEFNVYPYTEATRRQLRLSAGIAPEATAYLDTTLFGRTKEFNVRTRAEAAAVFAQPWGSADVSLRASHLLTRPDKYQVGLNGNLNFRIVQGLNANVFGNVFLIRDQINLPGSGATDEEILTRQRELATGYRYFMGLGMSYTFGSIFNPVVNARFGN